MTTADETFIVDGMSCASCENRISRCLEALSGVVKVNADHKHGRVRVLFNSGAISTSALRTAIEGLGYEVTP